MSRDVSAIIISYASGPELNDCVTSLLGSIEVKEVIVVDNGPDGWPLPEFKTFRVSVVKPGCNLGFAAGANFGVERTSGSVLLFLNADVIIAPSAISRLTERLEYFPGVCSPVIEVGATATREYGFTVDLFMMPRAFNETAPRPYSPLYVSGCCLATNRVVFEELGGFDPRYFMFYEDVEYCWQVRRKGYHVGVVGAAHALHSGGASTPGGYEVAGRLVTSEFRVMYRERNSLAVAIACTPGRWLPLTLCCSLARIIAACLLFTVLRRRTLIRALLMGIAWNARNLRGTLLRRRQGFSTRVNDATAWKNVAWRCFAAEALVKHSVPVFTDSLDFEKYDRFGDRRSVD